MANYGVAALLIASLLVAVTLTDARITIMQLQRDSVGGGYAAKAVPALTCNQVNAVQAGDTCSSIAESGGLTQDQFLGFNPNINCQKIFLGQWVCLDASAA
uniref:LysM domain-containing protein n=1 Tax=Hordeum vulgare subsp. vulgare TaxID=112509 RepID=A0A8I6XGI9_HORVV